MTKTVNGLNINYIDIGQGEPVIILHGWGSNITVHQSMINLLSTKYRVIAPDLPGFGESDEPKEPWDVDCYVDFLLDFLKDYNFKEINLFGHSFGGRIIIKLCSRKTDFEIKKVILADSAGVKPEKTMSQKFKQKTFKMGKKILSAKPVEKLFPDALENLRKKNGSADYNAASPIMRQTLVKVVNEDLCSLMPNVKCPTLLMWGTADDATPLSDGQKMEKLMPESALVTFEGAGHYSFIDRMAHFNSVLASFMNI